MDTAVYISEVKKKLKEFGQGSKSIGFIPTMGYLHEGHLSLVQRSKQENDLTVCSIFVNPTQFNQASDLENYPRDLERDLDMLRSVDCDLVFIPEVKELYPDPNEALLQLDLDGLDQQMEGSFRPGHFDGVVTVVDKFFHILAPNKAYFGEKDFQQLRVVEKLAELRHPGLKIIGCDIYRENSGLAMSSRNSRLNEKERQNAALIFRSLKKAQDLVRQNGITATENAIRKDFQEQGDLELEYFDIRAEKSLRPAQNNETPIRAFIAANVGPVRLIDNLRLID